MHVDNWFSLRYLLISTDLKRLQFIAHMKKFFARVPSDHLRFVVGTRRKGQTLCQDRHFWKRASRILTIIIIREDCLTLSVGGWFRDPLYIALPHRHGRSQTNSFWTETRLWRVSDILSDWTSQIRNWQRSVNCRRHVRLLVVSVSRVEIVFLPESWQLCVVTHQDPDLRHILRLRIQIHQRHHRHHHFQRSLRAVLYCLYAVYFKISNEICRDSSVWTYCWYVSFYF